MSNRLKPVQVDAIQLLWLQPRQTLPFRRMEVGPGDEVQVDFGQGAWVVDSEGKKRRPHLFRMVLSHSRKAYSEVVVNLHVITSHS